VLFLAYPGLSPSPIALSPCAAAPALLMPLSHVPAVAWHLPSLLCPAAPCHGLPGLDLRRQPLPYPAPRASCGSWRGCFADEVGVDVQVGVGEDAAGPPCRRRR